MNKSLKKIFAIIISVIICFQILPLSASAENPIVVSETTVNDSGQEEKYYCTATIEDNFTDDCVLIVIDHANSIVDRIFTEADFPGVDVKEIIYLTSPITPLFEESKTDEEAQAKAETLVLTNVEEFNHIIRIDLNVTGKDKVLEAIKVLEKFDFVLSAEPNYIGKIETTYTEIEPELFEQDNLNSLAVTAADEKVDSNDTLEFLQYALGKIQAQEAWSITTGSKNIKVGVVDTGIHSHPDLNANVVSGRNYIGDDANATESFNHAHGNMVAGIIGAVGNNDKGIAGINWNVSLVPLRIVDEDDFWSYDDLIAAINFARNNNIPIINCSLGISKYDSECKEAIENYEGLVVCSAGNEGENADVHKNYPAGFNCDNIISVAATKRSDSLRSDSNYGVTTVDLGAPGNGVWTTTNTGYDTFNQTSCAAPHVTGVAALILSVRPDLSAEQVKACILNGVDEVDALQGKCVTGGRLNAYKAVQYALSYPTDQMVSGDFNGDGKEDVASIVSLMGYAGNYNEIEIQVTRGGTSKPTVWHSTTQFNGNKIQGRVTAGDFNGDGKDDIATMYDYGNGKPKILVFLSTGSSFEQWDEWFVETKTYYPQNVTGHFTAGDFNGDGKDDIATLYDYTDHTAKILVFISNGTSFNYWTPWFIEDTPYYYNPSNVAGRFEAGDFNGDGKDDIATLYYYANETTKIHIFKSQGNTFSWFESWYSQMNARYYNCDNVLDRFEVADFNGDGKDDVATMYNKGSGRMQLHVFTSTGSILNDWSIWYNRMETGTFYPNNTSAFLACDANGDGKADVASKYDYRSSVSSLLYFKSTGSAFNEFTKWVKAL